MNKCLIFSFLSSLFFFSCSEYVPKPRAYPRIERQGSRQETFIHSRFSFIYPRAAQIEDVKKEAVEGFWFNIIYPDYNATIHCTYLRVNKNSLSKIVEETYHLAYNHASRAESISQIQYSDTIQRNTGIIYDIGGQVASPVQFYITDNDSNFLRGALYFNQEVKLDSVSPVVEYIRQDITLLIESLRWSNGR